MEHEPLHPLVRLILGDIDEMQIQFLEHLLGPLRGPRATLTLVSIGLPAFLAGAAVVYYDAFNYAGYFFVLLLLFIMLRVCTRYWDM